MTRSDIILAKVLAKTPQQKDKLIDDLHNTIEQTYRVLFGIEGYAEKNNSEGWKDLAKLLRDALESGDGPI